MTEVYNYIVEKGLYGGTAMIYITGDTHRDFARIETFCAMCGTTKKDILIILGDAGINYYADQRDSGLKAGLRKLPVTLFCLHGNHERRPETLGYIEKPWHGGVIYHEDAYPNLLFAKDGEVYDLAGKRCEAIGGAYSVDKPLRLAKNWGWWPDEQPSDEIKRRVEQRLEAENWNVDVVLSHTSPLKYEPTETFIQGIDQSGVDKSTEQWLDAIEDKLTYSAWYCGHYHCRKTVDKLRFMFDDYCTL
jgi:3-oxoacid CoA-transferase subunit A